MAKQTAIVIGAGIAGLATARALSLKGFSVQVFDKT
ncbi:FAD-dependent oxidoreductase, partial [Rhizobium leguminosarum]